MNERTPLRDGSKDKSDFGNIEDKVSEDYICAKCDSYTIAARDKASLPDRLVLPKEFLGRPVTRIRYNAFSDCTNIVSVVVPNTVIIIAGSRKEERRSLLRLYQSFNR